MKRLGFLSLLLFSPLLSAAERVALVIGNNDYSELSESRQLTSAVNDAKDVAAALKALGYTVVSGDAIANADRNTIITATETFASRAKNADAAVFYFSGHGIQVGEDNFLMPSDTPRLTGYSVLKNRSIHLREVVMVALEEAQVKTKVIILDCCRDNPFTAQLDQALGQIGKSLRTKGGLGEISGYGPGFFLAFATSPGTIADDGNGKRNSPFTDALLTHLKTSAGDDITPLFRRVKATVRDHSGVDQVPWTNDSLLESFAFGKQ
ncbi:MAG TPA: caspase family protein, partial [Verrucomicrobium sp.]|nr:caspase family protein [Verrucomicrobium sp.]